MGEKKMINLNEALKKYEEVFPNKRISSILDIGSAWVVSAVDKKTGLELDESPVSISKENADIKVFFPPLHREELKNALPVNID